MSRTLTGLVIFAGMVAGGCGKGGGEAGAASSGTQANEGAAVAEVRAVLDRYVKAVNEADEKGLRELWAEAENVSFVSPMQRMRSWDELQGFWQGFLKNSFKERELKPSNVAVHAAGDAAWAVFDWEFNATMMDGKPFQSRGWETHVYRKTDRGWRISHIHYSAAMTPPPVGGKTEP
jgi:uncharacterized protein (TIGR02246 family)